MPDDDNDFDRQSFAAFKARKEIYKGQMDKFERQEKAFTDLITFIQETIAPHNVKFIQQVEPHPWNHLQALKARLAPSDQARSLEVEQRYHKLCKGPGNQNMEAWLDEWTMTLANATQQGIAEVTGNRPVRDFLIAIRSKEPNFADAHLVLILKYHEPEDLYLLIEEFRQYIRL